MKKWSSSLIIGSIIILVAAIAYKNAVSESFFAGITFSGLFLTLFKSLLAIILVSIAIPIVLIALLIDLILWLFTAYYFPLSGFIYDLIWGDVVMDWYWSYSNGNELFISAVILLIIGFSFQRKRKRKR